MTRHTGSPIVSVFPGLELALQDALLGAIETVLIDAEAERIWIEESPSHDLRVYATLPRTDAPAALVVPIDHAPSAGTLRSHVSVDPATLHEGRATDPADRQPVE